MPGADWEQQVEATAAAYQQLADRVGRIQITESSPDGAVRVRISASGVLTDLQLHDLELAQQIMACLRAAQAKTPDQMSAAMHEAVGSQDPNTHLMLAAARDRFPELPAEKRRPARADMIRGAEGDWDERAVLQQVDFGGQR